MPDLSSALRDLIDGAMSPVDVDAIVRARRKRRLRRRTAIASVVAVVVVIASVSVLARPASEHKVLDVGGSGSPGRVTEAEATRAALSNLTIVSPAAGAFPIVGLGQGPVRLTDPKSGAASQLQFPVSNVQATTSPFVIGSNIVIVLRPERTLQSLGAVTVFNSAFDQWRSIGSASSVIASSDPDRVWIVFSGQVVERSLAGDTQSSSYQLTDGRAPLAAVDGGLLTARRSSVVSGQQIMEVWDPKTNHVVRVLPGNSQLIAAAGHYVVRDVCASRCTRHVLDLRTGRTLRLSPPAGVDWSGEGALSPDGTRLALVAHTPLTRQESLSQGPGPPSGTHASIISVFDLATGKRTDRRVTTWKGTTPLAWSPDSLLLFFTRDDAHVDYFNTRFADSPQHDVGVVGAGGFLLATSPKPTPGSPRYSYDGLVSQSPQHSPELCIYPTAIAFTSDNDSCSGPQIAGWDWAVVHKTVVNGMVSGRYHVVGTYDGSVFTLTEPPRAPQKSVTGLPTPNFASGCPTPAGGWQVTSSRVSFDDYTAVTNAARSAPDFAGIWFGPTVVLNQSTDYAHSVINIAFTGNLDAHRRALAALWGGPICVVRHPYAYDELQRISHELFADIGKQLGLQMISAGPDDTRGVVAGEAVAVSVATQRALDDRYGKGVVDLVSVLKPIP